MKIIRLGGIYCASLFSLFKFIYTKSSNSWLTAHIIFKCLSIVVISLFSQCIEIEIEMKWKCFGTNVAKKEGRSYTFPPSISLSLFAVCSLFNVDVDDAIHRTFVRFFSIEIFKVRIKQKWVEWWTCRNFVHGKLMGNVRACNNDMVSLFVALWSCWHGNALKLRHSIWTSIFEWEKSKLSLIYTCVT